MANTVRQLKQHNEFMILHTSRENCRKIIRAVRKNMAVIKLGTKEIVKPKINFLPPGVSFSDWRMAQQARRECAERREQRNIKGKNHAK